MVVNASCFFYDALNIILNLTQIKNHLAIQIHHFMFELLFSVYCSYTVFIYFPTGNKRINSEEQHVYSSFLNLCDKLRANLCDSFILLFFMFMNIVSMLIVQSCSLF